MVGRLAGLKWIRENVKNGILYFADDDNTYDVRVFQEVSPENSQVLPTIITMVILRYGYITLVHRSFPCGFSEKILNFLYTVNQIEDNSLKVGIMAQKKH